VAAYITKEDAVTRLSDPDTGFGLTEEEAQVITGGDLVLASDSLDDMAPFVGARYDAEQERQFPRSETLPGDTEGELPERVLNWVVMRAYQLSSDEGPAVTSEGAGGVSVSYAHPKLSQMDMRMQRSIAPYLQMVGSRV